MSVVLSSLNVEFNLLQNCIFIAIVIAHPQLNIILSWLRQLLTEPRSSSVTALILPFTPLTIPERVFKIVAPVSYTHLTLPTIYSV